MRLHAQHLDIALKPRKRKLPREKLPIGQSLARPRLEVTIARDEAHDESDDSVRSLRKFSKSPTIIDANDSDILCDIIELFCGNSGASNDRTTCPRISSSTELDKSDTDVRSTCKDCTECQLQQENNTVTTIHEIKETLMSDQGEEFTEHLDYYEDDVGGETASTSSTFASIEHEESPILVDLTSEESKQTILKEFGDAGGNSEMESRIMIADSSNRLQRTGSSLATALRDRGPCVIPVQPNRSLPIRPAPPTPTRPAASIVTSRKTHSPIFKLSNPVSLDATQMQSDKSSNDELNNFPPRQRDKKGNELMLSELVDCSDYILPDMTNAMQISKGVNNVKRKNGENQDTGYVKEITKDIKKRRKSHEMDANYIRDERVKNILKEYSRTCSNKTDEGEQNLQQQVVVGLWDAKRCSPSIVVSTTEVETERTKEQTCNKVVPPLRLKKIVREASTIEHHNIEVNAESKNEPNYRIVTGATPRPESPYGHSTSSFWSNVTSEKELETSTSNVRDKTRRSSPKSDGYKIKCRRNRLRQKLRELRGKALELSREMTVCNNATNTSPQYSTRLRQMMNCYEKQIENISKLLCKLSASIPPKTDDGIVDLGCENELDECPSNEKTVNNDVTQVNGISESSISPSPSPEPPKLSPRSPIDYEKTKSPNAIRDSPPVLPRVYIAIQSTALECLKQNLNTRKSWHGNDSSSSSPFEKQAKLNNTDGIIIHDKVITTSAISPVLPSFEQSGTIDTAAPQKWAGENSSLKLQNSEIQPNILEDAKTFNDVEEPRQATPPISLDNFLSDSTMNVEIDKSDMRNVKEAPAAQERIDRTTEASEIVTSKHIVREKQELEQKSNETLPAASPSLTEKTKTITECKSYEEERLDNGNKVIPRAVTAAHETPAIVGRSQTSPANVTNILQLQSNYYGSSITRKNVGFTGVIQNSRDIRKMTSNVNQSVALDPAMPLGFTQSGSAVNQSSNQQCVVLPKNCNSKAIQENAIQRNNGNCIMTEQFPTLGNWVARMSKKQTSKSKSKFPSGALPTASTAEVACMPGLESQKSRTSVPNNATRNNVVNVAPQWNTERWQRQQHQQRQQQLYAAAAASSAASVRPGICPPISVTQFYPPNYAIDPYSSAAFGYHSAICPYGDYSYHSRLHATASPISGYQINSLQDPHASPLQQMQHLDKRFPAHLQDTASRHFATDLFKYPGTLSTGSYQHAAAGLNYDRLRSATAVTQNATAQACLSPLLLPPASTLTASAQQTLVRTPLATYPTSASQCSRNRMIPDVVAAAAAAAVVAAASFGQQRGTLPSYGRTDTEMVSGVIDNESSQLMATNRLTNRERVPQEQIQSGAVGQHGQHGVNHVDSRALNNGGYHQLQNLILNRLPYVKTDNAYSQSSSIFSDNAQEPPVASSVSTSAYNTSPILTSSSTPKELARKESRNCETPHLGKVNHTQETTNNLNCSNCGLSGSMFKCLGCEVAFYCDERCQTRHWNIHVEKCPKKMPKLKKLV
ncbi:uncharacterized protein LOC105276714 isoform X1 [Ooceraea biroi]|uniref:uncharacterized protein LOC105276714 isoform X1 n=2 Tax=Ooceraea biroi TaxID=2015173 RepID=UPI000F081479|nr:uncharacterized protein LOC105276714 isoform X1 [Ooceraea biroi]